MMTVDNLPAELALEASVHFSKALFPYIKNLVRLLNKKPV